MIKVPEFYALKMIVMKLIQMSLISSFMILSVIIIHKIGKKIPKKNMCILWILVFLRMVCPWNVKSNVSILPIYTQQVGNMLHKTEIPLLQTGVHQLDTIYNRGMVQYNAILKAMSHSTYKQRICIRLITYIWLVGTLAILSYELFKFVSIKVRLSKAIQEEKKIYRSDLIHGAFLMGIFRPRIYISSGLEEKHRKYVLLHEQAHMKRRDHILKFLAFLITTMHWFNPLAWVAYRMLSNDIELAVDEKICLPLEKSKRIEYANTLFSLALVEHQQLPVASFASNPIKARIKHVLSLQEQKKSYLLLVIGLAILVSLCFGTCKVFP